MIKTLPSPTGTLETRNTKRTTNQSNGRIMNRVALILFALASLLFLRLPGPALADDPEPSVHILVDASGSMKEFETERVAYLVAAIGMIESDEWASITFFGGNPNTEAALSCDSDLVIEAARPDWPIAPNFPDLGRGQDKTAIGNAIVSVLEQKGKDSSIVLITDGDEECDADFLQIRTDYPQASFRVLKIGNGGDSTLRFLMAEMPGISGTSNQKEAKGETELVFHGPFIKLETSKGTDKRSGWRDAKNWLERYLWVICYGFICGGAFFLSQSFQRQTEKVIEETKSWEDYNRKLANGDQVAAEEVPSDLDRQRIENEGRQHRLRFDWMIVYAIVFGVPLAFLEDLEPGLSRYVPLVLFLLAGVTYFARKVMRRNQTNQHKPTLRETGLERNERLAFAAGALALATLIVFLVDFDRARAAAWVPLSSGFSAALTIVASTPFLFTGSRWWNLQKEKHTYYLISDQATRDRIKRRQAEQENMENRWFQLRKMVTDLKLGNPMRKRYLKKMPESQSNILEQKYEFVFERLRSLLFQIGGEAANKTANERYTEILYVSKIELGPLIKSVATKDVVESEEELKLWEELEAELSKRFFSDRKVEELIQNLHRLLRSTTKPTDS